MLHALPPEETRTLTRPTHAAAAAAGMVDRDDDPYRTELRAAWTAEDVRRAVRDGEDLDAVNSEEEQWTMLMWAAAREEADGVVLLRAMISAGADVEKKSAGDMP